MKELVCNRYRYYFDKLNFAEKVTYNNIVDGLLSFSKRIIIHSLYRRQVEQIMDYIELDIPEIFYLKSCKMVLVGDFVVAVIPQFRFSKEECKSILVSSEREVSKLIDRIYDKSDYVKEKAIHDYLVNHSEYKDIDAPYSHEMPGAIIYGISVCEGISKAFKYIADRVGLDSLCVYGEVNRNENIELHAWNMVQIDNVFYNIDITFDQSNGTSMNGDIRYDYFNVSDEYLCDRKAFNNPPKAYLTKSYYVENGLYAYSRRHLVDILVDSNCLERWITFQIPQLPISKDEMYQLIVNELNNIVCQMNDSRRYNYIIIPNYYTYVFSVRITFY